MLHFSAEWNKEKIFDGVRAFIIESGFKIDKEDQTRPWGGFFVIDEAQQDKFIQEFFSEAKKEDLMISDKLSPKILVVAPQKRLSWQYHYRRAEIWKLIFGEAGVITSHDDEEREESVMEIGKSLELAQGERHRLIGYNNWGIVAEIWRHTNAENPSNEDDIVRLQDDFGRNTPE